MKGYKELLVWQRSFALANQLYALTAHFPKSQQFGLVQQIQRAGVSVPSNIAEGANRQSIKEYRHFLSIALGSLGELETQIMIAQAQAFIRSEEAAPVLDELDQIGKMLRSLLKKLASST